MNFNNKKINNSLTQKELSDHYNKLLILCNSLNISVEAFVYASHIYTDSDNNSLDHLEIIYSNEILLQSSVYTKIQAWIKIMNIIYTFNINDILQIKKNIPSLMEDDVDKFVNIIEFFK